MKPSDSKFRRFDFSLLSIALCICLLDSPDTEGVVYPSLLRFDEGTGEWEQIARRPDLDASVQGEFEPMDVLVDILDNFNPIIDALVAPEPLTFNQEVAKLISTRLELNGSQIIIIP